ncbi:uncharacterized protein LOC133907678 isoform X2 [Phragmites australis]|uniref:uncharacterized protein LOC133907678 isoform X2 n=1 Tax=Phragmites australis TaxID=29695 RepID=UPI002D775FA1|nr:uncharacterized protein LOC133907678 isoform X2 [Phragmites australis]
MATAKAMKPAPPVRVGTGTAAAASPRISSPCRRRASGAIRASPASTCAGGAGDLPAPLLPNARRRGRDPLWHGGGFSLGVDLGAARTGLAVGRGITLPRPLTEADELIVGLPVSADGRETPQSNKVRSVAGRLAVQAAERGLRVYLQDEHGTSIDALDYMIYRGVKKSARDVKSDAYAAVMILERYFSSSGQETKIVLPRQPELQDKLIAQSSRDADI